MYMDRTGLEIRGPIADPLRACVHDLRNLFAVVASARSLLERPRDERRERLILDALDRVAVEGKIVTDTLLTGGKARPRASEASVELHDLAPLIEALERPGLRIDLSLDESASWIRMTPAEYRAVALELVTNAARAGARRIRVRAARNGGCHWLIVADDGHGFAARALSRSHARPAGLHGTGMRRLASAVRAAHGTVRIKSQAGRGSVVALILPIARATTNSPGRTAAGRSLAAA